MNVVVSTRSYYPLLSFLHRKNTTSRYQFRFRSVSNSHKHVCVCHTRKLTCYSSKLASHDVQIQLNYLYVLYFTACLMERTWRFALPLILANIEYRAVAVLCFVSPLACFAFAPAIGSILDTVDRSMGVATLLGVQCISIILSGLLLILAFAWSIPITHGLVFIAILALSMIEKLAAVTSEVAIERDWITRLCGKENSAALAHGNSMLRRMDLACDFIGTVSYGWIFDVFGPVISLIYSTSIAVISTPILYRLVFHCIEIGPAPEETERPYQSAWKEYFFNNPILPSSIALVLLFFNVALSPGGILTAFLTSVGVTGTALAMFRGACALMGFVGSWCGKILIKSFGLFQAGHYAIVSLLFSLGSSLAVYVALPSLHAQKHPKGLLVFACGIILSRIGLWSFDMVNAQLFQQYADESQASSLASTEMALCSLSEIFMLGVALLFSGGMTEMYLFLVLLSYAACVAAWILYYCYLSI
jgi:hypothetical protein